MHAPTTPPRPRQKSLYWAILGVGLIGVAAMGAGPLSLEPKPGMVLLRNGQIVEGKVAVVGEFYHVLLPAGEIRLKARDVEFFCHDLAEGFRLKRARIDAGRIDDRLDLAEWCIRHGLCDEAKSELEEAQSLDAKHPRLPILQRRLDVKLTPPAPRKAPLQPTTRINDLAELDRLVQSLPKSAVEQFTNSVQPLLMNHCATSGCHGPGVADRLSLLRQPVDRMPSRRTTQRNLQSILSYVDFEQPESSPLLIKSIEAHGPLKKAPLGEQEQARLALLVAWLGEVASAEVAIPASAEPPEALADDPTLHQDQDDEEPTAARAAPGSTSPSSASPRGTSPRSTSPRGTSQRSTSPRSNGRPKGRAAAAKRAPARKTTPEPEDEAQPDPYDPAPFNERFSPKPPPDEGQSAEKAAQ